MIFSTLITLATSAATVAAHGFVTQVRLGGVAYDGWFPFEDPWAQPAPSRIVRRIPHDGPIEDRFSPDLACNAGGNEPAGLTGEIAAGSNIDFVWSRWPRDHKGPVTVMLASCQGSCTNFRASNAQWFSIQREGLRSNGNFASDDLIDNGVTWSVQIPANLRAGEYLVRIELLALHSTDAPQMYPACAQIRVTGGGDGGPAPGETISITQLYQNYHFANIYWPPLQSFDIAGPAVAGFVSGAAAPPPPPPPAPSPPQENPDIPAPGLPPVTVTPNNPSNDSPDTLPPNNQNQSPLCRRRVVKKTRRSQLAKQKREAAAAAVAGSGPHHHARQGGLSTLFGRKH